MKNYKIKTNDAQSMVLERDFTYSFFIVILVGVGLMLLSVGLFLFIKGESKSLQQWTHLLILMGLTFVYIGLIIPRSRARYDPYRFVFDHQAAQLKVVQDLKNTQSIAIPYTDIATLDIKTVTTSSSSSAGHGTGGRTYTYFPLVVKKDGSVIELAQTSSLRYAQQVVDTLNAAHQKALATNTAAQSMTYALPQKIDKSTEGEKVVLQWRNAINWITLLGTLLVCCTMTLFIVQLGSVVLKDHNDIRYMVYFFFGFMLIIMIIVLLSTLYDLWRNFNTIFGISIAKTGIEFFELDSSSRLKHSELLHTQSIGAIIFNFKISEDDSTVQVLTNEQFAKMQSIKANAKHFSWSAITESLQLVREIRKIDIRALNVVERIQLEYWLQQTLQEQGNKAVL